MARIDASSEQQIPVYRVDPPRAGDAIGHALRGAYERDFGLPEDFATLLRRLNRDTRG